MSEQEQGGANDAPAQPRWQAHPPPANAAPAQPSGPAEEPVDDAPVQDEQTARPDAGDVSPPALEEELPPLQDLDAAESPGGEVVDAGATAGERAVAAPVPATWPEPSAAAPHAVALEEPVTQPEPEPDFEPSPRPGLSADAQAAIDVVTELAADLKAKAQRDHEQLAALVAGITEANRLRSRDQAHMEQLHTDNTTLRRGELTSAMAPLLTGLVRLADQMASMAAGDKNSIAGMLRVQLLQTLDVAGGVTEFSPAEGDAFDAKAMTGAAREETTDPDLDGTVARTVRSGFARGDGAVIRVAEVVVRRLAPTPRPASAGPEQ